MSTKTHRRPTAVATTVLVTGVAASLAGNVQAINLDNASPGVGAHVSAVFWPAMLFLVVELLIHVPWNTSRRDRMTKGGVLFLVAGVSGWVSYWHLANVLSHYGYDVASRYAGPLAVDAAMVLAALALNRVGQARRAAVVQDAPAPFLDTPRDMSQDEVEEILSRWTPSVPAQLSVADEARTWLDSLDDAAGELEPTLPVPVSPSPSNTVKPESVPDSAAEMLLAWAAAPRADRPAVGQVDALVAAAHNRSTKTARRWRTAVLAG